MASLAWFNRYRESILHNLKTNLENIDSHPGFFLKLFNWILSRFGVKEIAGLSVSRLLNVFDLNFTEPDSHFKINKTLNLLFVSTNKDFKILPFSIQGGFYSTSNFSEVVATVIVPEDQVGQCTDILRDLLQRYPVTIISETSIVPTLYVEMLKTKFGWRYGWVLQQILKTMFAKNSHSDYVLIIDSDTVLLKNRNWVMENGKQLLTPSWEFNPSYYEFLHKYAGFPLEPKYTFVSHHMLIQPHIFTRAALILGWETIEQVIRTLINYDTKGEISPFCIEYELYGQYLSLFEPENCFLEKWGNTSVPAEILLKNSNFEELRKIYGRRLASVSAHSYLTNL